MDCNEKNVVFLHLVDFEGSKYIAHELLDAIIQSDLIYNSKIFIYCNYDENNFSWLKKKSESFSQIKLFFSKNKKENVEIPTLIELKKLCDQSDEEFNVLYLHHKGATQPYNYCVKDWRDLMIHFTIKNWKKCVEELKTNDVVGVNWRVLPYKHFSGNFWWSKSSYVKILPKLKLPEENKFESQFGFVLPWGNVYRHDAEFWIGLGDPKVSCVHSTDHGSEIKEQFNHYTTRYDKNIYDR
jgi:hypothetical protein